jgi:ABC-type bacteriocin/lantibiotic exporter with double-glycine peptidase domain
MSGMNQLSALLLLLTPAFANGDAISNDKWRRPERDAANALYFLAHTHSVKTTYEDVLLQLKGGEARTSLDEIMRVASRYKLNLRTVRVSPKDLSSINQPVIGFYEERGAEHASFVVILSANNSGDGALLFDAGLATIRHVSDDEFRRGFSGYILMRDDGKDAGFSFTSWMAVAAIITSLFVLILRFRSS